LPVVIASANGIRGVKVAYDKITAGEDTLDAIIAGVNVQELDPDDQSVGLGGYPNADGVVQLDASCMHGPTKRAGSVACLEDIATPSLVAKAIMDYTDHIMLGRRREALWSTWGSRPRTSHRQDAAGLAALEGAAQPQRLLARSRRRRAHQVQHRHHQHERGQRRRRRLLGDDDERHVVEDPGTRGRLLIIAAILRHRRLPIHRARDVHQGVRVRGGTDALGRTPEQAPCT
jgi:isoaspartyl peptidase/L-asparaginase-like protein (Ntn-hydrolase superfamily)